MSQLGPNIDPRKLLAAAAAAGKLSSLQNATAPATQVLPTETQNKPKRPSGPKSILESRLFKVSTCIFFLHYTLLQLINVKTRLIRSRPCQ